jgi:hypothetical protein
MINQIQQVSLAIDSEAILSNIIDNDDLYFYSHTIKI